jgi:alpha-galactosidase
MRYRGDWLDGQNRFRRLMLREFSPASHPPMKLMPVAAGVHGVIAFNDTTEERLLAFAADVAAAKLPLDTYWLDAGWNERGFPMGQGNPEADPVRFPRGLAPVGNAVRKAGMRFLAWFEPERAMRGTWLDRERPQWLLRPSRTPPELRYQERDGFRLLDLGNLEARRWMLDSVSRHIRDAGIAIYRQDFNLYPAYFWHTGEDPESIGLREVRHISGLYDFLDELARRHPALIIDNCASGGRRLDFEMMRRSVVLTRSDSMWGNPSYPRNVQAMTHGLSLWLPLHGLGADSANEIALRSGMGACATFSIDFRNAAALEALKGHLARYLSIRELFTADYYPLTPWSLDPARWLAFQFHDPVSRKGIVQAFCGPAASVPGTRLRLRGLEPAARYALRSWDSPKEGRLFAGRELMLEGLTVTAARDKEALVFEYSPT